MPSISRQTLVLTPTDTRVLRRILLDPNVCGVGYGARRTSGERRRERCICFYVREKYSDDEIRRRRRYVKSIPEHIGAYQTDVLALGSIRANAIDHSETFSSPHSLCRAAALARPDVGSALALLPGHAALPGPISVDGWQGNIRAGGFGDGGSVDWAVAELDVPPAQVSVLHRHSGLATPFVTAAAGAGSAPVSFYSPIRDATVKGRILHAVKSISIEVRGQPTAYSDLLLIHSSDNDPFSVVGDSGALVFDGMERPIGMIVGAATKEPISMITRLSSLLKHPPFQQFRHAFFQ